MSVIEHARKHPEKLAAIMADTGRTLTYAQLAEGMERLASRLRQALDVGDRVAVLMENDPRYFIVSWATRRAGLYCVPVNWHLGPDEVRYIIRNSGAKAVIVSDGLVDTAISAMEGDDSVQIRLTAGAPRNGFQSLDAVLADASLPPVKDQVDGSIMFYSSGTTGFPKGIKRPLPTEPFGTPHPFEPMMRGPFGMDENSVYFSPAPLYHGAAIGWSSNVQAIGGTVVFLERFDAEAVLDALQKHGATHAQFVPTHFVRMLKLPEDIRAKFDPSRLRHVLHSAAPCAPDVKRAMIDWFGPVIDEYYAATEGSGFAMVDSAAWLEKPGTIGKALMGKPHVLDEEGRELPPGEIGAIYFEDPDPFEYHDEPDKTAEFFNDRGWGCNGDMGWIDEDGYLFLTDRRSHMIISGGVNIYPAEAENILITHPKVADASVIGVPNEEFGEEVKAVVELVAGHAPGEALAEELLAFCKAKLATYKCPRSIDFIDALPRLPTGKVRKNDLRQRYWGENRKVMI